MSNRPLPIKKINSTKNSTKEEKNEKKINEKSESSSKIILTGLELLIYRFSHQLYIKIQTKY